MEHTTCVGCGAQNLKTDPQCLTCGKLLLIRPAPLPVETVEAELEPIPSFWETPTGQRRIALLSGGVMLLCLWVILRGIFGIMLIPLAICAGLWELNEWSKERKLAREFESARNKEELQATLARHARPDRIVQTRSGPMEVRGFDSRLD